MNGYYFQLRNGGAVKELQLSEPGGLARTVNADRVAANELVVDACRQLVELIDHCANQGAFANGVAWNGVDEGEVGADKIIENARQALAHAGVPAYPPTALGELQRQAAFAEHLAAQERERGQPGDPDDWPAFVIWDGGNLYFARYEPDGAFWVSLDDARQFGSEAAAQTYAERLSSDGCPATVLPLSTAYQTQQEDERDRPGDPDDYQFISSRVTRIGNEAVEGEGPSAAEGGRMARAAAFFSEHPEFCGHWLDRYRKAQGLSCDELAAKLECTEEALSDISLCFAPRADHWDADVAEIAARFGCDPQALSAALAAARDPFGGTEDEGGECSPETAAELERGEHDW